LTGKALSKSTLLSLIDAVHEAVFVVEDGQFVFLNDHASHISGYSKAELMAAPILDLVHEDDRVPLIKHYRSWETGDVIPARLEIRLVTKRREIRHVSARISIQKDDTGKTLYVGSLRDDTESKHTQTALAHSQADIDSILSNLPDVFYRTDAEGIITMISPSTLEAIGYTPDEMIGKPMADFYHHPGDREKIVKALTDGGGKAHHVEAAFRAKDGTPIWVSTNAYIRFDNAMQPLGIEGIARNISERKDMEKNIENMNRAKSEFLANMSHELRTPLNAILGFSQIMEGELFGKLNKKYREYTNDINESALHLLDLINDVLDMSTIEAKEFALNEEHIDLQSSLHTVRTMIDVEANKKSQNITASITPSDLKLHADGRLIKQIMGNLLSNAVKFTPQDGEIEIGIKLDQRGGLAFAVRDTGIGIAEQDIPKVLEPFGQIKKNKLHHSHKGTGLGLPITKQLAELHGGALSIESQAGRGTTVTVTFPPERTVQEKRAG